MKWKEVRQIYYEFRRLYVCDDKAIFFNEIEKVLYSYDYY